MIQILNVHYDAINYEGGYVKAAGTTSVIRFLSDHTYIISAPVVISMA
jgi:hypothetical protein